MRLGYLCDFQFTLESDCYSQHLFYDTLGRRKFCGFGVSIMCKPSTFTFHLVLHHCANATPTTSTTLILFRSVSELNNLTLHHAIPKQARIVQSFIDKLDK